MKKRATILLSFLFLFRMLAVAQEHMPPPSDPKPGPLQHKSNEPFWDPSKLTFGGMIGASFGTITYVNLSPTIGYRFTKKYEAGLGPVYMYFSYGNASTSIYGGTLYSRFYITNYLFAHAMYQPVNGPFDPNIAERFWLNNVWVGGGLKENIGRGAVYVLALVNINQTTIDFPHSPWVSIGFMF